MNWIPFVKTGNSAIDMLMSQVSDVAKMWRRTDDWCQGDDPHSGLVLLSGAAQDAANQFYDDKKQSIRKIESLVSVDSVEDFIKGLEWSDDTPDIYKTLVAGNIRNFAWIVRHEVEQVVKFMEGE